MQSFSDKNNILSKFGTEAKIVLELGCGPNRRIPGSIGIDILDLESVDIVTDLNQGLSFIPSDSVDEIYSFHFLEHLDNLAAFMKEIHRVLKKGGKKIGKVPHSVNPYFFSDPTHKTFFGLYTFCYFSKSYKYRRKVPNFYNEIDFEISVNRIIMHSEFPLRKFFKKIWQKFFNSNTWLLEYYEENMVYIFPPYELYFELVKR